MYYHDRKIREAINREEFNLPAEYEGKLQSALQQIEESDCIGIEKHFRRKRVHHKLVLALVSMMAVFALMGAGQLKKYMAVDLLGNVTSYDNSSVGDEDWSAIQAYGKKNVSYGQFLKYSSVYSVSVPYVFWQEMAKESDVEKLRLQAATHIKMPSALPEGYQFTKAEVQFYLQGDVEQCELKKTEKKGGYIYQIFDFPEGFEKYVSGLCYTYETEDGHFLVCLAQLMNNGVSLFDEESSVKKLDMEGYQSAQEVTSKDQISLLLTEEISPVEPVMDILDLGKEECFQYLKKHRVPFASKWKTLYDEEDEGETETEDETETEEEDLNTFYYISYWWWSDVLSGEELQEIAKGMQ